MRKRVVRKIAEVGCVPLYLSALALSGASREFESVVDEVAQAPGLFCGVLFSNGLCLLFFHVAISWFRG